MCHVDCELHAASYKNSKRFCGNPLTGTITTISSILFGTPTEFKLFRQLFYIGNSGEEMYLSSTNFIQLSWTITPLFGGSLCLFEVD
mmetsp:Transcript_8239/g.12160  ORF Transcript_8239/g.12160 Transcript_8239/m.12160 type:complete len:87 (+) Transcript_8239:160-420(+)